MKRLIPVPLVVVLLSFLFAFVPSVVYSHPSWVSYEDSAHTTECNNFTASKTTVYMQGGGFTASHDYKIAYYENKTGAEDSAWRVNIDTKSSNAGNILESELCFLDYAGYPAGMNDPGIWHAVVYDATASPPSTYNSSDLNIVEDDSFNVTAAAIPEFPTVIAGIGVAGLCFGIYYWMRRKTLKFKMQKAK